MTKKAAALLLAASLAVSMCATPVFAADPETGSYNGSNKDGETSANTVVTYRVDCSYTWSIPKKIDFGENAGVRSTRIVDATNDDQNAVNAPATNNGEAGKGNVPKVCVTKNIIDVDKILKINVAIDESTYESSSVAEDPGFYVEAGDSKKEKLYFGITKIGKSGNQNTGIDTDNTEILSVPSGTNTDEQGLVFTLNTSIDSAEKAGTYNGKVVFKSELK